MDGMAYALKIARISIHAPARGATDRAIPDIKDADISIHAPARGATKYLNYVRGHCKISIHAPARGATTDQGCKFLYKTDFNPRSREGSDLSTSEIIAAMPDFNPRSREGSDWQEQENKIVQSWISIHAPARGATDSGLGYDLICRISIHAPARGATFRIYVLCRPEKISIHAPARGATYSNTALHTP